MPNISTTESIVLLGKALEQYWYMLAITEGNRAGKSDNKIIKSFMKVTGESSPATTLSLVSVFLNQDSSCYTEIDTATLSTNNKFSFKYLIALHPW